MFDVSTREHALYGIKQALFGAGVEADSGAGGGGNGFISFYLFIFYLSAGTKGSGGKLRHLAGSPGGGGVIRSCHTLVRVNTV